VFKGLTHNLQKEKQQINRRPTQTDADFFMPFGQKYYREATVRVNLRVSAVKY
jgi:hypothetical protein